MPEQYDNTNRGSGWLVKAVKGKADVNGQEYYLEIIETGATAPKAPSHHMYLTNSTTRDVAAGSLWRDTKNEKRLLQGQIAGVQNQEWWVSVFLNHSQHPNSPLLDVTFKAKEEQQAQPQAPAQEDDIPF